MELWLLTALLMAVLVLAAYRLGIRDGLWQAGKTLPGPGGKKKTHTPQPQKSLAARVEEY